MLFLILLNLATFFLFKKEIEHIRVASSIVNKPLVLFRDENVRTLFDVLSKGLQISGTFL
jgi:hypothetical protein